MKHTIKVLTVFPLLIIGYVIGFVWQSFAVGICAGQDCVNKLGDKCAKDSSKRKENGNDPRRTN